MKMVSGADKILRQAVALPEALVNTVLKSFHDTLQGAHAKPAQMYEYLKRYFFWRKMKKDIQQHCNKCIVCITNKTHPVKVARGHLLIPQYPMHIVYIDIAASLETSVDGKKYIIILVDSFSKWLMTIPISSMTALNVAKQINERFFQVVGNPDQVLTDQGGNVDGDVLNWICRIAAIRKRTTQSYTPRSDLAEAFCKKVGNYLRETLAKSEKKWWSVILPQLIISYNSTPSLSTGYTPNEVFLGRIFENFSFPMVTPEDPSVAKEEYVEAVRKATFYKWMVVKSRLEAVTFERQKEHNENAYHHDFKVGDMVMVRDNHPKPAQTKKLADRRYGPMLIIAASNYSLCVIPMKDAPRMADLGLDGNLFKKNHQGTIECKPFVYRYVPVDHCVKVPEDALEFPPDYDENVVKDFLKIFDLKWDLNDRIIFSMGDKDFTELTAEDADSESKIGDDSEFDPSEDDSSNLLLLEEGNDKDLHEIYKDVQHEMHESGEVEPENPTLDYDPTQSAQSMSKKMLPSKKPGPLDETIYDPKVYKKVTEIVQAAVKGKAEIDKFVKSRVQGQEVTALPPKGIEEVPITHKEGDGNCFCELCTPNLTKALHDLEEVAKKSMREREQEKIRKAEKAKEKVVSESSFSPTSPSDSVSSIEPIVPATKYSYHNKKFTQTETDAIDQAKREAEEARSQWKSNVDENIKTRLRNQPRVNYKF